MRFLISGIIIRGFEFIFFVEIFVATSMIRPREDVAYCIHVLSRRLAKTRNWTVLFFLLLFIVIEIVLIGVLCKVFSGWILNGSVLFLSKVLYFDFDENLNV